MHNLEKIYSPELLNKTFKILEKKLTKYLENAHKNDPASFQYETPEKLFQIIQELMIPVTEINDDNILKKVELILEKLFLYSRRLHSPHYIGHQVSVPVPFAAAMEGVSGVINQGAAVFEMGPFVLSAERVIVKQLARYISSEQNFEGIVTHGGTLANLTALLVARNLKLQNSFKTGNPTGKKLAIITSSDAHYCIARAMGVMGLGTENLLKAPIDPITRKIDNSKLEEFYQNKKQAGYEIFALVGSACSTPIGAIDDLDFLGDFCAKYNLWFHVDAAHGGGFLLSSELRTKFKGIEKADTIAWDAHKMMHVPALCTFVFYKRKEDSYKAFSQDAPYLFDNQFNAIDFESGLRTFECTKGTLILPLLTIMATLGDKFIGDVAALLCQKAMTFYQILKQHPKFETLHEPEANILCFRYKADNQAQDKIRTELLTQGDFYITATTIDGTRYLRVTVMNPLTRDEDFQLLLRQITHNL